MPFFALPRHRLKSSLDTEREIVALAKKMGVAKEKLEAKIKSLHEFNPMLGHRGCRLAVTYPEIYDVQVEAIFEAACAVAKEGKSVIPEVMIRSGFVWRPFLTPISTNCPTPIWSSS